MTEGAASIAVFGATGRTGRLLLAQAVARGLRVTAFARDQSRLRDLAGKVTAVEGGVSDLAAVERAVTGRDAVLSALGHVRGSPSDLLASSVSNVVEAMGKSGVRRLVVLTNTAVEDPSDKPPVIHRILRGTLVLANGEMLKDSLREAEIIARSGLDWTIVRAPLLTDGPLTGRYRVGPLTSGTPLRVSRADVAHFMLSCVTRGDYVGQRPVVSGRG